MPFANARGQGWMLYNTCYITRHKAISSSLWVKCNLDGPSPHPFGTNLGRGTIWGPVRLTGMMHFPGTANGKVPTNIEHKNSKLCQNRHPCGQNFLPLRPKFSAPGAKILHLFDQNFAPNFVHHTPKFTQDSGFSPLSKPTGFE